MGEARFLDVLMEEHRGFKAMLTVLESIATRLASHQAVPPIMVTDTLDFFEYFADRHHGKEEDLLFPLLASHGLGPDKTVVSALLSQHEAGRAYAKKMRGDVRRYLAGEKMAARDFATHAYGYVELIREHIRIEDNYFYHLADQLLTRAEQQSVIAQFGGVVASRATSMDRQRYLRMLEEFPGVVAGWV